MPRDAHSSSSCSVPLVQPRPGNGSRENPKLTVFSVGGVPKGPSRGVAGHREVRVELGIAVPVELCQLVCLHQEGKLPHQPDACQNRVPGFIRSTATPGQPTIFLFYLRQPFCFLRNAASGLERRPTVGCIWGRRPNDQNSSRWHVRGPGSKPQRMAGSLSREESAHPQVWRESGLWP